MATFLKFVTHDTVNNTLEATWLQEVIDPTTGVVTAYITAKCRNYSAPQKADFLADVGTAGQQYVTIAGW